MARYSMHILLQTLSLETSISQEIKLLKTGIYMVNCLFLQRQYSLKNNIGLGYQSLLPWSLDVKDISKRVLKM